MKLNGTFYTFQIPFFFGHDFYNMYTQLHVLLLIVSSLKIFQRNLLEKMKVKMAIVFQKHLQDTYLTFITILEKKLRKEQLTN